MHTKMILMIACAGILTVVTACANFPVPTSSPGNTAVPIVNPMPGATVDTPSPLPVFTPSATRTRVTPTPVLIDPTKLGAVDRDITYCTADDIALKLDLYYPKSLNGKPFPVVVNIHGGSWSFGDKKSSETAIDIPELTQRGYVVAVVDYRLAPKYKFPAQIEDVKCAVRFLRAHSATYHLDAKRVGAWGCSAGGHLAALLGVTDPKDGFDKGEYIDQSSRIQAVVALTAPMNINLYDVVSRADMLGHVFGTTVLHDPIFARASPVTYVSKDDPPFLMIQGDKDGLIVPQHGEQMQAKLMAAGVFAELATVKDGHHCLPAQSTMSPSREEISRMIANFFDQKLW